MTGVKISALPAATVANANDQLEVNQAGTSRSMTVGQIALLSPYLGTTAGADTITVSPTAAITVYTTGAFYIAKAGATNATTTPTLNISALGAKTIVKRAATALAAGDIVTGMMLHFVYDGTNMQLLNPVVN